METKPVVKTLAERLAKNRNRDSEREMGKWMLSNYSTRCPTCHQQLWPTNFWKTVGDVEVRVGKLPYILTSVGSEALVDTVVVTLA